MPNEEHEEHLNLIPAYALNSLDADEAEKVSQHLPGCEICQAELATYTGVVDVLPLAAPEATPSPALKERLMSEIESGPTAETPFASIPKADPVPEHGWWHQINDALQNLLAGPRWRPAALLFVLLLVSTNALVWLLANDSGGSSDSWRRVRLAGTEVAPEATGIIYISADGQNGTVIVDGLPQLGSEQQYQLWLIEDGERSSGVVFSVDNNGYRGVQIQSPIPLQEYGSFGVTIEPAGGSPAPTGDRVLGSNL